MRPLSEEGHRIVSEIAQRHGVSTAAVAHLLVAVMAGYGTQAQFNHPDLGGMGQWSQGGMTMVGDMFNNSLKAKVDALCTELSALVRNSDLLAPVSGSHQSQSQGSGQQQDYQYQGGQYQGGQYQGGPYQGGASGAGVSLFVPGSAQQSGGWPAELGQPSSTGAQNNLRYAFFPAMRRLLIDNSGRITVYDTRDHQIGGFSQQQSGDQSLTFTSQYGLVRVADLEIVSPAEDRPSDAPPPSLAFDSQPVAPATAPEPFEPAAERGPAPAWSQAPGPGSAAPQVHGESKVSSDDIIDKIERLAGLRAKGILTDSEFEAKKTELLSRL